jgi:hypothetical protein
MLALTEQKLCYEDKKIWFRSLSNREATLENLLCCLEGEMKTRMRANAPSRASKSTVFTNMVEEKRHKCWICINNSNLVEQRFKLKPMKKEERLKLAKENKACFSCLKRASVEHNIRTCTRRKQCTKKTNGYQCKYYHHPWLHNEGTFNGVAMISGNQQC